MHSSTTPSRPALLRRILNRGRALGGALALVALMALLPVGSVLQANHDPSTPVVHSYSVNFTSTGQSQLGPFAALALGDASFEVFDESWDEADTGRYVWNTEIDYPGWVEDAFGVHDFNADFGGEITGSTSGRVQSEIGMRDFTTAAVDVTYPVNITLTTPEAESFIPGSTISIGSSWDVADGWDIVATNGGFTLYSSGIFGLAAGADGEICVFDCEDFTIIPDFSIPETTEELFSFDVRDDLNFTIDCDLLDIEAYFDVVFDGGDMPCDPVSFMASNYGISGSFGIANPAPVASLDGTALSATGTAHYVDLDVDFDHLGIKAYVDRQTKTCTEAAKTDPNPTGAKVACKVAQAAAMEALKLEASRSLGGASIYYNVLDLKYNIDAYQTKTFDFSATPQITLPLPQAMDWVVSDEEGVFVKDGRSSSVKFDAGHQVALTLPSNLSGNMSLTPTFDLTNNEISAAFDNYLDTGYSFNALAVEASVPSIEVIPELCDPTGIAGCFDSIDSPAIEIPAVGPLLSASETLTSTPIPGFTPQGDPWALGGFSTFTGSSFVLNPELAPTAVIRGNNSGSKNPATTVAEGASKTWYATSSTDPDGDPLTYEWDFGDGQASAGTSASHAYADNGTYTLRLTATDHHGLWDDATLTITVSNVVPTVSAGAAKTVDEGSQVGLGIDLFGRNLVVNPGAQSSSGGWSNFSRASYGADGSASPHKVTLIDGASTDSSVTSYYKGLGLNLNGSSNQIPGAKITVYDRDDYTGTSATRFTTDDCLHNSNDEFDDGQTIGNDISSITLGKGTRAYFYENPIADGTSACDPSGSYDFTVGFGFDAGWNTSTTATNLALTSGMFNNNISKAESTGAIVVWDGTTSRTSDTEVLAGMVAFADYRLLDSADFGCLDNNDFHNSYLLDDDPGVRSGMDNAISSVTLYENAEARFERFCGSSSTNNWWLRFTNDGSRDFVNLSSFNPSNQFSRMWMRRDGSLAPDDDAPAPALSAVSDKLGNWLNPTNSLLGEWKQKNIPLTWNQDTENAIIYKIVVPEGGLTNARLTISGEDGAFVWLDGSYSGGAVDESGIEKLFNLGELPTGTHYIQIIRMSTANTASPSWTVELTATSPGGMPANDSPGSPNRRSKFFQAGNSSFTTMSQTINVSAGASQINANKVTYDLSAYLGGFSTQSDNATVTITFKKNNGNIIGSPVSIGPVTKGNRSEVTGMLLRQASGAVPANTRKILVALQMDRNGAPRNDGYADDISLVLFANGEASFTDPGVLDTHTATINWGDSTGTNPATVTEANGDGTAQGSHVYGDDTENRNDRTVTLTVTDKDGAQGTDTFPVTVRNVAPTVTPSAATYSNQQSQTRVLGTFTDPGFLDTHTVTIDWGDGHTHSGSGSVTESNGAGTVSGTHKYQLPSNSHYPVARTAEVCVADDDGDETCGYATITILGYYVSNMSASSNSPKNENSNVTLTGSAGTLRNSSGNAVSSTKFSRWDYGDGASTSWASYSSGSVSKTHRYSDDGVYTARFFVKGNSTNSGVLLAESEQAVVVTVNNALPSVSSIGGKSLDEGAELSLSNLGFSDAGPDDTHTAVVDWGDGSLSEAIVNQGTNKVSASHVYNDSGSYTATLTVTDDDGGSRSRTFSVTVANRIPNAQIDVDSPVEEGGSFTVRMINPSDPRSVDTAAGFTYAFDCGDGSGLSGYGSANSHVCPVDDEGTRAVVARLKDKDGDHRQRSATVAVEGVAPTANLIVPFTANEGDTVWMSLSSAYDPSTADTDAGFSYRFSCDAGSTFSAWGASSSFGCATENDINLSVVVAIADEDGLSTAYAAAVEVHNIAPSATFVAPSLIDEGSTYVLALASATDPSSVDTALGFEYLFKCDPAPLAAWGSSSVEACTAGDNGTYIATGSIRDVGPHSPMVSDYSTTFTVVNVAPVIDNIVDATLPEGSLMAIVGGFADPGPDAWSATVDFGDGGGVQPLSLSGKAFELQHTYASFGTYFVQVSVADDDGGVDSETFAVSVRNVSPHVAVDPVTTITEGDLFVGGGQFIDPGANTWTATVNYGDGTGSSALTLSASKTFSFAHVYADEGVYIIVVCVSDSGAGLGCDGLALNVLNAAPEVEAGLDQAAVEGDVVSLDPATFHDQGTADVHNATINWGDGTAPEVGAVTETPFGPPGSTTGADGSVDGSHVYADNGVYAVEVCVADDDDAITCDSLAVTVANAAPGVNAGDDVTIVAGQTFGMTGAFSDAGAADTHSAEVNWDDESVNEVATVTQGSGSGTAAASHQYLVAGIYTVQLCVTDDDGGVSCDDLTLEVISAAEATARFVDYLDSLDLPAGIENSLLSKLQGALESFEAGDDKQGLNQLKAFINAVEAQDGKKIDGEDASALVSMAEQIMDGVVSQGEVTLSGSSGQANGKKK